MKKVLFFVLISIVLSSCSSSDDNNTSNSEFIVGLWKITQRIENGNEVELTQCDPVIIHEFRFDNSMKSSQTSIIPGVVCGVYDLGIYAWEIIEDGHYARKHISSNDYSINYYREGSQLRAVYANGDIAYYTRF